MWYFKQRMQICRDFSFNTDIDWYCEERAPIRRERYTQNNICLRGFHVSLLVSIHSQQRSVNQQGFVWACLSKNWASNTCIYGLCFWGYLQAIFVEVEYWGHCPNWIYRPGSLVGHDPINKCETEIDILALDDNDGAIFGECKWTNEKVDAAVLDTLIDRSQLFRYKNNHLYLFAKSGFTSGCIDKAKSTGNVTLVTFDEMVNSRERPLWRSVIGWWFRWIYRSENYNAWKIMITVRMVQAVSRGPCH